MAVVQDIIEGADAELSITRTKVTRVALVHDLAAVTSASIRVYAAILAEGMPSLLDEHPTIPGIIAVRFRAKPHQNDIDIMEVMIDYETPGTAVILPPDGTEPAILEVGSTVEVEETQRDREGNDLVISYTDPATDLSTTSKPATLSIPRPTSVFRYSRLELGSPGSKSKFYVGKLNAQPFADGIELQWMCRHIGGRSQDGGVVYDVLYEFQFKEDGWDPIFVAAIGSDGLPIVTPGPVIEIVGEDRYFYDVADFNDLSL